MIRRASFRSIALLAVLCVAACDSATAPVDLDGTEWTLTSINGAPALASVSVSLEFTGQGAGGYAGCNWYGGRFTATGSSLSIDSLMWTERACAPIEQMTQESAFLSALSAARSYRVRDGRLELMGASGNVTLVLERRVPAAMTPASLVGTRWRLDAASVRSPFDAQVTLAIGDGTASGFAGCRSFDATYTAKGDRISVTSITMRSFECALGNAALEAEGQLTTDLSEATYWRLEGGKLELTTAGGRKRTFVPAP
jgi:heat shock protein HslJ